MITRADTRAMKVRDLLMPMLTLTYGETGCRVEDNRLIFNFSTEDNATFGQASIFEFLEANEIRGRLINDNRRTVILILKRSE
jgi:hypothetical protein